MYNIYKVKEVGDKIEIQEKKGSYRGLYSLQCVAKYTIYIHVHLLWPIFYTLEITTKYTLH